ncbi:OLC1v1033594C1 [Oldenlandia corymbosa var. corymbosa]|uniref:OLC1v1033594C1 n=1 Tax=Oldenlandia corymbosa var. corymbosa TaxID=529605 RepID=A0AAV1CPD2_OLDCO|nr:OLC1v1033594C1 [Oldenlandia corymbosa var. corymbosa]
MVAGRTHPFNAQSSRNLGKTHLGGVVFGCKTSTMKECLVNQLFGMASSHDISSFVLLNVTFLRQNHFTVCRSWLVLSYACSNPVISFVPRFDKVILLYALVHLDFRLLDSTMPSSLAGLPAQHFSYVKNIIPGLPLFLFNYSDRTLHGIFEAASAGQMNINPYGWTSNGSDRTLYPAQVQIRLRLQCQPLREDQFKSIILDNYYSPTHFWFELDHAQTCRLMSKLSAAVVTPPVSLVPHSNAKSIPVVPDNKKGQETGAPNDSLVSRSNLTNFQDLDHHQDAVNNEEVKDTIYMKLKELAQRNLEFSDAPKRDCVGGEISTASEEKSEEESLPTQISGERSDSYSGNSFGLCNPGAIIDQLLTDIRELRAFQEEQIQKSKHVEHKLLAAEREIIQLKSKVMILESKSNAGIQLDLGESIFLVGGYDGSSWLSALNLYCPSRDVLKYLKPMDCARSYSSVVKLNGELYVIGGGNGSGKWYDTVDDKWCPHPSLNEKKGSLGGAALDHKIYAIGGGNRTVSLSNVEMYDINVGRWIQTRSMQQKRFALAATELNGVLYAVGGYDGDSYLESAERFDPREHSWSSIGSMNVKRGCHSLLVLNEKLYALGGFDGSAMTATVEIYEPRMEKWYYGSSMSQPRGYLSAAVLKDSIYVIGGVNTANGEITESVATYFSSLPFTFYLLRHGFTSRHYLPYAMPQIECYKEDKGWKTANLMGAGKRCFSSAIVFGED